jgi:hypothetical protein
MFSFFLFELEIYGDRLGKKPINVTGIADQARPKSIYAARGRDTQGRTATPPVAKMS